MKRWILLAVGVVLALVGAVWVLQGIGVLGGSFMTGQKLWFLIGLIAFLGGVVLVAATATRRKPATPSPSSASGENVEDRVSGGDSA
ncbi:hypothetical protein [Amycolatopsis sp. NPDC059021]|uniref:hypothetical protein n=1 Tax=Amycolatopsis sp. NPDC059021 TaxID=3346704 RepID=UPI00366EB084